MTIQNNMEKVKRAKEEIKREYKKALGYARRYGRWDKARMLYPRLRLYEEALQRTKGKVSTAGAPGEIIVAKLCMADNPLLSAMPHPEVSDRVPGACRVKTGGGPPREGDLRQQFGERLRP